MPPQPPAIAKMPFDKYRPSRRSAFPTGPGPSRQLDRGPELVQRGPARRQPGADRPDGPGAQADAVRDPGRHGIQGDRGRLPVRVAARLRLHPPDHRGGPDPRRRDHPGAGAVPARADRADLRGHRGAPSTPSCTSTTRPPTLQRRVVFGLDKAGIIDIATSAARLCRKLRGHRSLTRRSPTSTRPESFTGTEPDFAVEICEAVMDVIEPTPERPMIINLPTTVEMYTPNVYADVIEWFGRHIRHRDSIVLSSTPTTTGARRWPRPSSAQLAGRRPGRGHPVRQRRAHRQRRRGHPGHEPVLPGRRPRARPARHRRPAPGGRALQPAARSIPAIPTSATSSTPRSPAPTRTPSRRAWTPSRRRRRRCGWEVPYLPIDPKHVGPHLRGHHPGQQPVGQRRRGLPDGHRARPRPAPAPAGRVLQGGPGGHRGQRHRDQAGRAVGRVRPDLPARRRRDPPDLQRGQLRAEQRDPGGRPRSWWTASTGRSSARATARSPPWSTGSGTSWASSCRCTTTTSTP